MISDMRDLAYDYLTLPYNKQITIAKKLEILPNEMPPGRFELCNIIFANARVNNKLEEIKKLIDEYKLSVLK